MARQLPLQEAARVLGLSERTVRRRLQAGTMAGEKDPASGRWHVMMPDEAPDTPADAASTPDNADQRQRVAVLEVQLEAARRELATATTTLAIERQRYADQRETFETMLRLLPAPPERRRRWPWRRE